jgi:hypothetical protein
VSKVITDREVDWYRSAYVYGEDAKDYWEANEESIKGYNGETYSSILWFDLDSETDTGKARKAAIALCDHLAGLGFSKALEIFFSGSKGFHVILHTKSRFLPTEVSAVCYNLAMEAGVPQDVFDTSVYNVTRIFRIPNTRHQKSKLYKIPISIEELKDLKLEVIKDMAKELREEEFDIQPVDAEALKKKYANIVAHPKRKTPLRLSEGGVDGETEQVFSEPIVDFSLCPPGHRRCVYALEQGDITPGQRHEAVLRLAAYYKGQSYSREYAGELIEQALHNRSSLFPEANQVDEAEVNREIDQVYGKDWKGGTYSCKTDTLLQSKCDHGNGPCYNDAKVKIRNVISIEQLANRYVKYGEEAKLSYPKMGIPWLDERVRLRPKNFSILAGANGSGKTSLMIQTMEALNDQKIFHVFFSMDMADSSIFEKLGAKYTQYSQRQIEAAFNVNTRNSVIIAEVMKAVKDRMPFTLFDFSSAVTLQYIEQTVMSLKQVYDNLQLAIVDYAGRLMGEFENQYASSTQNAMMANDVAKRTNCHFLFLAQVSRENGDHTDPLRSSRVSKDSGAWEENATCVLTCWRPLGSGVDGEDKYIHIYVAKNRSGPLGENVFGWEGKTGTVYELRQDEFEDYCVAMEQAGLDRPKFNWFDEPNKEDDVPVADRGRSAGKFGSMPPKENRAPRIFKSKEKSTVDRVKEVLKDETLSSEVKRLAQQQEQDARDDERQTVPSGAYNQRRRNDRSS